MNPAQPTSHFVGVDVSKDTLHINGPPTTQTTNPPIDHYYTIDNLIPTIED